MKNKISVIVFVGLNLLFLLVFQSNGANAEIPTFEVPDVESNLVVVAVGFRKTAFLVNGLNVPIFTTVTNILERLDTGVLCSIVSPTQFANTFFVLERQNDEMGGLTVMMPSYEYFKIGRFYLIPYSIVDLGFGQGTNMYFKGGGALWLNAATTSQDNNFTISKLQTAGDYIRTRVKRYYASAEEARDELLILRSKFKEYEKQYEENKEGIENERDRRKKMGIVTYNVRAHDDTDKLGMLRTEQYAIGRLYSTTKREIVNAEAQLRDYEKESRK